MAEKEAQALLFNSGVALPAPNAAEMAKIRSAVEQLVAREQIEHQMIMAAAPKPTWGDIRAVWWMRLKGLFFVYTENGYCTGRPRPAGILIVVGLFTVVFYGWRRLGKRA